MRHFYYTPEKNGVDLICDACGDRIFLKRLSKNINCDETYEATPEGWFYEGKTEVICPKCREKLSKNRGQMCK